MYQDRPWFEAFNDFADHWVWRALFVKFTVLGLKGISNESYPHKDAQLFFEKVYESFGPKRIMWGSNYPPVLSEEGYEKTLLFLRKEIPYLSADDKYWLMGKTAPEMWCFHQ